MSNKDDPEKYISDILKNDFNDGWYRIYKESALLRYLNLKRGAIHGNTKTRRALANWYAIYSILYFYEKNNFINNRSEYLKFDGFKYSDLFDFQREQYGGEKLQNHGLNSRVNDEFANKITSDPTKPLIIKNNGKYLIQPEYLYINGLDITASVLSIIRKYQEILKLKDNTFESTLSKILKLSDVAKQRIELKKILNEDTEARVFEIMSYAILEAHYRDEKIFIGRSMNDIKEEYLKLYKTGRTNANDGGIDFVMRPIGRFFQVTEVDNYDKYFLDIDKVNHFPITFVVKTKRGHDDIFQELLSYGDEKSGGLEVLKKSYHQAIEGVITINELSKWLNELNEDSVKFIIDEIDRYFKLEMNIK